jgi:hypothetical protein
MVHPQDPAVWLVREHVPERSFLRNTGRSINLVDLGGVFGTAECDRCRFAASIPKHAVVLSGLVTAIARFTQAERRKAEIAQRET